jgi:DNA repair photolyase
MQIAKLKLSSYPNCIKYHELDVITGCNVKCIYCGLADVGQKICCMNIDDALKQIADVKGIYLSPNTDAFSKICADTSHNILEYCLPKGIKFLLITKNVIPTKTIELIAKYPKQITVKVSLARINQELINYIEPGSASALDRLKTMKLLVDAGLKVQALLMPLYPGVDDDEEKIINIVEKIHETGVRLVKAAYVVIRKGDKPKDKKIINKMLSHAELKNAWNLMTEVQKIQIGEGQIYPFEKRLSFYRMLAKICTERDMKFSACTVLDIALKNITNNDFLICKNLYFLPELLK